MGFPFLSFQILVSEDFESLCVYWEDGMVIRHYGDVTKTGCDWFPGSHMIFVHLLPKYP